MAARKGSLMRAKRSIATLGLALPLLAATLAGADAAEMSAALQAVTHAADAEAPLRLVWAPDTLGGSTGAKAIQDSMNKMFGTHIEIKFVPGASMPQVGLQIAEEYAAGRSASSDVYLTSLNNAAALAQRGIFRSIDWKQLLPGRITDAMIEADGTALKFVSTVASVAFNTQLLPHPPKTLAGFLEPEFKGKIATTPYAAGFDALGATDVWGPERTIAYAKALSGQISGLIRCADMERIASGEFAALVMACNGSAQQIMAKGAPIGVFVPEDAATVGFFYFLVPKNAASPNAATVFIAYMMTPEGQKFSWDSWKDDLHFFPESRIAQEVRGLLDSGIKVKLQSIQWSQEHPEAVTTLAAVTRIFATGN